MRRAHRRLHLWIWVMLTPIIIAGFILALKLRPVEHEINADIETIATEYLTE